MKRAATALLAMAMAAGCGSDNSAKGSDKHFTGCDAGEMAVEQPAPAIPRCVAADGGTEDASTSADQ